MSHQSSCGKGSCNSLTTTNPNWPFPSGGSSGCNKCGQSRCCCPVCPRGNTGQTGQTGNTGPPGESFLRNNLFLTATFPAGVELPPIDVQGISLGLSPLFAEDIVLDEFTVLPDGGGVVFLQDGLYQFTIDASALATSDDEGLNAGLSVFISVDGQSFADVVAKSLRTVGTGTTTSPLIQQLQVNSTFQLAVSAGQLVQFWATRTFQSVQLGSLFPSSTSALRNGNNEPIQGPWYAVSIEQINQLLI